MLRHAKYVEWTIATLRILNFWLFRFQQLLKNLEENKNISTLKSVVIKLKK